MTLDMLAGLPRAVSVAKDGPDALRQAQATLPDPMLLEASGRRSAFWRAAKPVGGPFGLPIFCDDESQRG